MTEDVGFVTLEIAGGPLFKLEWADGMNAQAALEQARDSGTAKLDFALQYYGGELGYMVVMINGTFESFEPGSSPNYYWDFLVNGQPAAKGIDSTVLHAGDKVVFELTRYVPEQHDDTPIGAKYRAHLAASRVG